MRRQSLFTKLFASSPGNPNFQAGSVNGYYQSPNSTNSDNRFSWTESHHSIHPTTSSQGRSTQSGNSAGLDTLLESDDISRSTSSNDSYDDLDDILSHAWEDLDEKDWTFRRDIMQRRLGIHSRLNQSSPLNPTVFPPFLQSERTFSKSQKTSKTPSVCFVELLCKMVNSKRQPAGSSWFNLARCLQILAISAIVSYFACSAAFIVWQLRMKRKHENDNVFDTWRDIAFNQVKVLWKAVICLYYRDHLDRLMRDSLMVRTLLKHVKLTRVIPLMSFILGALFAVLDLIDDFTSKFERIYTNSTVSALADPILISIRCVISVLFIWCTTMLFIVLGGWCSYLSHIIKNFLKDLDEDAVICEYNFFLASTETKKSHIRLNGSNHTIKVQGNPTSRPSCSDSPLPKGQLSSSEKSCTRCDQLVVLTNEEILLMYTYLRERLVYTSERFELWLALSLLSCALDSVIFLFEWVTQGVDIYGVSRQICILCWFPLLVQNVLRVNSQLNRLPKHIYPVANRAPVFTLMSASKAELCIYGAPLTYGSVSAVFLAICVGLITRLLVQF